MIMLYFTPCALGAPASDDLSVFEKREDIICYSFILFKIFNVTSEKHHYTKSNKPTSQYSFIIAYVAILMAREGSGWTRKISPTESGNVKRGSSVMPTPTPFP